MAVNNNDILVDLHSGLTEAVDQEPPFFDPSTELLVFPSCNQSRCLPREAPFNVSRTSRPSLHARQPPNLAESYQSIPGQYQLSRYERLLISLGERQAPQWLACTYLARVDLAEAGKSYFRCLLTLSGQWKS